MDTLSTLNTLNTLSPYGLNEDEFFWLQNMRRDVDKIVEVPGNC